MSLILTRSPFLVSNNGFEPNASLTVDVEDIINSSGDTNVLKTYSLNFRRQSEIDISQLIYSDISDRKRSARIKTTVRGTIPGQQTSTVVINVYVATRGYFFFQEGYNYNAEDYLVDNVYYTGSTDCIYKLDDEDLQISLLLPKTSTDSLDDTPVDVLFLDNGSVVKSENITLSAGNNSFVANINSQSRLYDNFEQRTIEDGGIYEGNVCNDEFFDEYSVDYFDSIRLVDQSSGKFKDIKVVNIEECKYKPIKLRFINRFGVEEDLWFFKRSQKSMDVSKEVYRGSIINSYKPSIFPVLPDDSTATHLYRQFNINSRESMVLNSGYVPEEFYNSFKQLLLSEFVWAYLDDNANNRTPVNIKSTNLVEKLHRNEKLINYEIEIEFAFDTIGNIV